MYIVGDLVTPGGIATNSQLEIDEHGRIASISPHKGAPHLLDFTGLLIVPGFIDIHIHGGGGADFMDGTVEAVRTVARTHAKYGTTTLLATTLTASRTDIDKAIRAIVEVVENPQESEAVIGGIHLEGPYICQEKSGAQPKDYIRPPDIEEFAHWLNLARGYVRKITLAPDTFGANEFIRYAVEHGVTVSIGHTNATGAAVTDAIALGATHGTHLFNAMSAMTHRSPGTAGALIASDDVSCELICDGVHVDRDVVKIAVRAKGTSKIILITDAMSGTAMPDGNYLLGGQRVVVAHGSAKFVDGTLAGSVLTMDRAFRNIQEFAHVTPFEAATMSSSNAAKSIGLGASKGSIELGKDADLTVIDPMNGEVAATIRAGKILYSRSV